ncbi:maleylpyruvate isomerase N-terminal domain-containing protein [Nonomuraea typhae]|uniref:maleylpyruvate isomerase N-terminal domain-containing protein n=1 Tax=Nonomuraea typhae TaxID=2603600 RepID=UPI0012FAE351|nr:maleylpyruvate isomerase N-terminal domain-containing protein [Nonomuraea typhae]
MGAGTALFLAAVDGLPGPAFAAPSPLPGWTRAHVVAHVHYNAEALRRLTRWARTGEPTPMYPGGRRAAEIEDGATQPPEHLRELVHASAAALAADFAGLSPDALAATVVTAQGRSVPAAEIAWLRAREVMVHTVDLDAGLAFPDLPEDFTTALVTDVAAQRCRAGEAAALASWLTGRSHQAPSLGTWL